MAYPDSSWEIVKAFFEQGLSLTEIIARPEVQKTGICEKGSISRKAKQDGWIKGKNATLVAKEIELKQYAADVEAKKATFSATEREIHNTLLMERLKTEQFFRNATLTVAKTAVEKLVKERSSISFAEMDAASRVISRSQDSVLGKTPDTAVTVIGSANAQAAVLPAPDEYGRILKNLLEHHV